jgi:hypothetical protein
MVTKSGYPVSRDRQILRDIVSLAEALGVRTEIDNIESESIEDFVAAASKFLNNGVFLNWCIGGSAYLKDDGNKDYTLYLPKYDRSVSTVNFAPLEKADAVTKFAYEKHVQDDTKKADEPVSGWDAPAASKSENWKPTGFEL